MQLSINKKQPNQKMGRRPSYPVLQDIIHWDALLVDLLILSQIMKMVLLSTLTFLRFRIS